MKLIGDSASDTAYAVVTDSANDVIVVGTTYGELDGPNAGNRDSYLAKLSSTGATRWLRQFGSSADDVVWAVSVDSSDNIYVAGWTWGSLQVGTANNGSTDAFVAKYNSTGGQLWVHQMGTSGADEAYGVHVDASENVYVAGATEGNLDGNTNAGKYDVFISKLSSAGTKLWTRVLGTSATDQARSLTTDGSGNVIVGGFTEGDLAATNLGNWDMLVAKFDSSGAQLWVQQLGTSERDAAYGVSTDASGSVYVAGSTYGSIDGTTVTPSYDAFLSKCGQLIEFVWRWHRVGLSGTIR